MLHKGLSLIEPRMPEIEMDSLGSNSYRKLAIKTQFFKKIFKFHFFSVKSIWISALFFRQPIRALPPVLAAEALWLVDARRRQNKSQPIRALPSWFDRKTQKMSETRNVKFLSKNQRFSGRFPVITNPFRSQPSLNPSNSNLISKAFNSHLGIQNPLRESRVKGY